MAFEGKTAQNRPIALPGSGQHGHPACRPKTGGQDTGGWGIRPPVRSTAGKSSRRYTTGGVRKKPARRSKWYVSSSRPHCSPVADGEGRPDPHPRMCRVLFRATPKTNRQKCVVQKKINATTRMCSQTCAYTRVCWRGGGLHLGAHRPSCPSLCTTRTAPRARRCASGRAGHSAPAGGGGKMGAHAAFPGSYHARLWIGGGMGARRPRSVRRGGADLDLMDPTNRSVPQQRLPCRVLEGLPVALPLKSGRRAGSMTMIKKIVSMRLTCNAYE